MFRIYILIIGLLSNITLLTAMDCDRKDALAAEFYDRFVSLPPDIIGNIANNLEVGYLDLLSQNNFIHNRMNKINFYINNSKPLYIDLDSENEYVFLIKYLRNAPQNAPYKICLMNVSEAMKDFIKFILKLSCSKVSSELFDNPQVDIENLVDSVYTQSQGFSSCLYSHTILGFMLSDCISRGNLDVLQLIIASSGSKDLEEQYMSSQALYFVALNNKDLGEKNIKELLNDTFKKSHETVTLSLSLLILHQCNWAKAIVCELANSRIKYKENIMINVLTTLAIRKNEWAMDIILDFAQNADVLRQEIAAQAIRYLAKEMDRTGELMIYLLANSVSNEARNTAIMAVYLLVVRGGPYNLDS